MATVKTDGKTETKPGVLPVGVPQQQTASSTPVPQAGAIDDDEADGNLTNRRWRNQSTNPDERRKK